MKNLFISLALFATALLPNMATAQKSSSPSFGGYVIGKYAYSDNKAINEKLGFSLRTLRVYVKGSALEDFNYFMQMDMSGVPGVNSGPKVLDAYGEWCKYDAFQIRIGQFNRPFTFEPPINPWNVGYGDYSQATVKLVGGADRNGEPGSITRDTGAQIQGDLVRVDNDSRALFHYQIGIFNGQGINHTDMNDQKDIIGGVWIAPIKDLRIGAFGWLGSYTSTLENQKLTVDRKRLSFGIDYESDWVFRSEYIASQGGKLTSMLDYKYGSKSADAWYVTMGAPIAEKLMLYGKWDVYRDEKSADSQISQYGLALSWWLHTNVMFQLSYAYVDSNIISYSQNGNEINRDHISNRFNQLQFQAHYRF